MRYDTHLLTYVVGQYQCFTGKDLSPVLERKNLEHNTWLLDPRFYGLTVKQCIRKVELMTPPLDPKWFVDEANTWKWAPDRKTVWTPFSTIAVGELFIDQFSSGVYSKVDHNRGRRIRPEGYDFPVLFFADTTVQRRA